ncbi:hypothetical protein Tco_1394691 [Tanacetum coccineum]
MEVLGKQWKLDEGQGATKGMSVKEYLGKTLKPDDEDKALSDKNQHTSSLLPLDTHQKTKPENNGYVAANLSSWHRSLKELEQFFKRVVVVVGWW